MEIYADSSFLVSLFAEDEKSAAAKRFMRQLAHPLPFNPLHRLEVRNAMRLAVKRGELNVQDRKSAFAQIDSDLRDGYLIHQPIDWTDALRRAEALSGSHTETLAARAMDILHVAVALESDARNFVTFDVVQRRLAQAEGLKVPSW